MGVTCEILLTNSTQWHYRAGQAVPGLVKYTIDKPTEFTSVTVSLRGQGSCRWLGGLNHIGSTCVGTEDYVDQRMDLLEAKKGTIAAGSYEKEFRFVLPQEIPSTYKDLRCFIKYFVELVFLKSNGKRFSEKVDLIYVQGGIKPRLEAACELHMSQPTTYEATAEFPLSKRSITFNVDIGKTHLNPGETILLYLHMKNLTVVPNIAIRTELIEYITYKSNCNHEKQISKTVNGAEVKLFAAGMNAERHDLEKIATTRDMFTIHSNILTREYKVKVVFKLPLPYKEVNIEIPIVIEEKIEVSEQVELVDLPPSYSQVMNQEEK